MKERRKAGWKEGGREARIPLLLIQLVSWVGEFRGWMPWRPKGRKEGRKGRRKGRRKERSKGERELRGGKKGTKEH